MEILREWLSNKNRDLRERKEGMGSGGGTERKSSSARAVLSDVN